MSTSELKRAGVLARVAAETLTLGVGGGVDGGELSPGEAVVSALSGERAPRACGIGSAGRRVESGDGGAESEAGAGAGPGEVRRRGRRAVWADAGGRASGE